MGINIAQPQLQQDVQHEPAQVLASETSDPKKKLPIVILLLIAALLIIVVTGYFGYKNYISKNQIPVTSPPSILSNKPTDILNPTAIPSTSNQISNADSDKWITFKSKLGFSFNYLSNWGAAEETIAEASASGQGDSGKTYELRFKSNNRIYGAGKSIDFSAGRGGMREDYSGNKNGAKGVKSYLDIVDPGCFNMGAQNSFMGNIDFNLQGKEISGVRLFFPILSSADYAKIANTFQVNGSDEECWNNEEVHQKYLQKGTEIREIILSKKNIDSETNNNLNIFNKVVVSSKTY